MREKLKLDAFWPVMILMVGLMVLMVILTLVTPTRLGDGLSLVVAVVGYGVVPGYCLLLRWRMDAWERLVWAVPVSVALVSITIYLVNSLWRVQITSMSVLGVIGVWTVVGLVTAKRGQSH